MEYIIPKVRKDELETLNENKVEYFKDNSDQDIFIITDAFGISRVLNLIGRTYAIKVG